MKNSKKILKILIFIEIIILTTSFLVNAESKIEVKGTPSYELIKEESNKYYYEINVTLTNSGDETTPETIIKLYEGKNPTLAPNENEKFILQINENKNFTFYWPTSQKFASVDIKWKPTSLTIEENEKNTGSYTLQISQNKNDDSNAPGFEIILILFSIILIVFSRRKK